MELMFLLLIVLMKSNHPDFKQKLSICNRNVSLLGISRTKRLQESMSKNANRKGSLHRKSYTVEFKMQTIRLLDEFSQKRVTNKWEKVCDKRGIPNKSMIIKWNQCQSKIFEEAALNRLRKRMMEILKKCGKEES